MCSKMRKVNHCSTSILCMIYWTYTSFLKKKVKSSMCHHHPLVGHNLKKRTQVSSRQRFERKPSWCYLDTLDAREFQVNANTNKIICKRKCPATNLPGQPASEIDAQVKIGLTTGHDALSFYHTFICQVVFNVDR